MPDSLLEPEHRDAYAAWKAGGGTPAANAAALEAFHPVIMRAAGAHVDVSDPILASRARRMALTALRNYDPSRGRLQTHLYGQLQGLKRVQHQQNTVLSVPGRVAMDKYHLDRATESLTHELNREPTDAELADHLGVPLRRLARIRTYRGAMPEGTISAAAPGGEVYGGVNSRARSLWHEIVYQDLGSMDQKIFEHSAGLHGRQQLSNQALAQKLRRSPGFISQRKKIIQDKLDREQELSPF